MLWERLQATGVRGMRHDQRVRREERPRVRLSHPRLAGQQRQNGSADVAHHLSGQLARSAQARLEGVAQLGQPHRQLVHCESRGKLIGSLHLQPRQEGLCVEDQPLDGFGLQPATGRLVAQIPQRGQYLLQTAAAGLHQQQQVALQGPDFAGQCQLPHLLLIAAGGVQHLGAQHGLHRFGPRAGTAGAHGTPPQQSGRQGADGLHDPGQEQSLQRHRQLASLCAHTDLRLQNVKQQQLHALQLQLGLAEAHGEGERVADARYPAECLVIRDVRVAVAPQQAPQTLKDREHQLLRFVLNGPFQSLGLPLQVAVQRNRLLQNRAGLAGQRRVCFCEVDLVEELLRQLLAVVRHVKHPPLHVGHGILPKGMQSTQQHTQGSTGDGEDLLAVHQ
mmetsp:Transcript_19883/g.28464  ORF Transcript_19883/g.28464 Transcript_19883/m.28464 type:complete len:390 (+) Transcript_19883:292-1461(+)